MSVLKEGFTSKKRVEKNLFLRKVSETNQKVTAIHGKFERSEAENLKPVIRSQAKRYSYLLKVQAKRAE